MYTRVENIAFIFIIYLYTYNIGAIDLFINSLMLYKYI